MTQSSFHHASTKLCYMRLSDMIAMSANNQFKYSQIFYGYIGILDGMLHEIRRLYKDHDRAWCFNGLKKMHCINNTMIMNYQGLFILH